MVGRFWLGPRPMRRLWLICGEERFLCQSARIREVKKRQKIARGGGETHRAPNNLATSPDLFCDFAVGILRASRKAELDHVHSPHVVHTVILIVYGVSDQ